MAPVLIYTRDGCPYCTRAKALLETRGIAYEERNATRHPPYRAEMIERSGGMTYPQVFIRGTHVGGCDDLHALDRRGGVEPLLNA